ncbi:DUF6153 family protein [Micromonospora sp. DT227]|uniref:DUF6153 family protein n=1 Tax=Micromonospora sp. DT227 TaxID=3393433 RepID=UPI003CF556E1
MYEASLRRPPLLRLVLLVALAFGVFGMHTFGHPPDPAAAGTGHTATAAHQSSTGSTAEQGHGGSHGHDDGVHPFAVCLAVLGSVLLLSFLPTLRQRRWDPCRPAGSRRSWATGSRRGPPRRPIGLHLTAVSVLRT